MFALITTSALFSCSNEKTNVEPNSDGQTTVKFNVAEISFEDISDISNKASGQHNTSRKNLTQTNTIQLDNGFLMVASLTPEISATGKTGTVASATGDKKAATVQNQMAAGVKYKIIAYNSAGVYVQERDYTRGQENSTADFTLDGGATYTFIIYSINTAGTVPALTFAVPANKTLATTSVTVSGISDFLFASKSMTLIGGVTNKLDVILKHKFSQITTTIDATRTGYNITAISSNINTHSPNATIALSDGTITRSGATTTSPVTFATLGGLTATSTPTIINAAANSTTSYTLTTITIGPLTRTGIVPFTNLNITPGVKYNMKVNITPIDTAFTVNGQAAVRISGKVWMRYNLGANTALDPDQDPQIVGLHGNYYQWGRSIVVANATTPDGAIQLWNSGITQPATAWNTNTEASPVKNVTNDPCPTGFRIPTQLELQELVNETIQTNIGTFNNSSTNYTAGKVFTSKRKATIKLTFPIAGNRYFSDGSVVNRGNTGFYWSSYTLNSRYYHYSLSSASAIMGNSVAAWGFPVRCIQQ